MIFRFTYTFRNVFEINNEIKRIVSEHYLKNFNFIIFLMRWFIIAFNSKKNTHYKTDFLL